MDVLMFRRISHGGQPMDKDKIIRTNPKLDGKLDEITESLARRE